MSSFRTEWVRTKFYHFNTQTLEKRWGPDPPPSPHPSLRPRLGQTYSFSDNRTSSFCLWQFCSVDNIDHFRRHCPCRLDDRGARLGARTCIRWVRIEIHRVPAWKKFINGITQTRLCNIQRFFTAVKMTIFRLKKKKKKIFFMFLLKICIVDTQAVLTSTHHLCFRAKIRNIVYLCTPHVN